jgi:hypothetical protein
MLQGE